MIVNAYPDLRAKKFVNFPFVFYAYSFLRSYTQEVVRDANGTPVEENSGEVTLSLEVVGGEVKLQDQLREYADRGDALEDMGFMEFFKENI